MRARRAGSMHIAPGVSGESEVNVGLTQGEFEPTVVYSCGGSHNQKKVYKNILRRRLYADDLAIVAECETNLQEQLIEWKHIFIRHGLRLSLEKAEVM